MFRGKVQFERGRFARTQGPFLLLILFNLTIFCHRWCFKFSKSNVNSQKLTWNMPKIVVETPPLGILPSTLTVSKLSFILVFTISWRSVWRMRCWKEKGLHDQSRSRHLEFYLALWLCRNWVSYLFSLFLGDLFEEGGAGKKRAFMTRIAVFFPNNHDSDCFQTALWGSAFAARLLSCLQNCGLKISSFH